MSLPRRWKRNLLAAAVLAVAGLGALGYFNWWIRHTWTRLHLTCIGAWGYYQLVGPFTPEVQGLFLKYAERRVGVREGEKHLHPPGYVGYLRIDDGGVSVETSYWLFAEPEMWQFGAYMGRDLESLVPFDERDKNLRGCRKIEKYGIVKGNETFAKSYPFYWNSSILYALSFGALNERSGRYTPIGRFFRELGGDDYTARER
ncbi:hypothetical protein [Oleispirillum naphthae]|uniref:hypothetical protein n=1 Tax=Oleispirillum naphthae TaxID=2838853 RepID=UPI00308240BE